MTMRRGRGTHAGPRRAERDAEDGVSPVSVAAEAGPESLGHELPDLSEPWEQEAPSESRLDPNLSPRPCSTGRG